MDRISIQDLKGRLSAAVAAAEAGRTVLITRDIAQHEPSLWGRPFPTCREPT